MRTEVETKKETLTLTNGDLLFLSRSQSLQHMRSSRDIKFGKGVAVAFARFVLDILNSSAFKGLMEVIQKGEESLKADWEKDMIKFHGKEGFESMPQDQQEKLWGVYYQANYHKIIDGIVLTEKALEIEKREILNSEIDYEGLSGLDIEFLLTYFNVV